MEDIKIRLSVLEMKVDKIMKDISKSDSNNSFGLYHLVKPKGPPPSKKRPKTIKRNKGGKKEIVCVQLVCHYITLLKIIMIKIIG